LRDRPAIDARTNDALHSDVRSARQTPRHLRAARRIGSFGTQLEEWAGTRSGGSAVVPSKRWRRELKPFSHEPISANRKKDRACETRSFPVTVRRGDRTRTGSPDERIGCRS